MLASTDIKKKKNPAIIRNKLTIRKLSTIFLKLFAFNFGSFIYKIPRKFQAIIKSLMKAV